MPWPALGSLLLENPEGAGSADEAGIGEKSGDRLCRGRGGWQGMGTEVPPPSGCHKAVHLSMRDKALETGENKPCTRKERARMEKSKKNPKGVE